MIMLATTRKNSAYVNKIITHLWQIVVQFPTMRFHLKKSTNLAHKKATEIVNHEVNWIAKN